MFIIFEHFCQRIMKQGIKSYVAGGWKEQQMFGEMGNGLWDLVEY